MKISKLQAYSVERRAYSQNLSAIRYPLNAISCIFCILFFVPPCFAQPISSTELINNAASYDNKFVTYGGEVIGDIMARAGYAWVNISDGKSAIGIWLPGHLAKDILYTGSYKSIGDWVEVGGTFRRACQEHGGDLDIHAISLRKINAGREKPEELNPSKRNFLLILTGILCLVLILTQLRIR